MGISAPIFSIILGITLLSAPLTAAPPSVAPKTPNSDVPNMDTPPPPPPQLTDDAAAPDLPSSDKVHAQPSAKDPTLDTSLPEIEARSYDSKTVRRSTSNRTYLLDSPEGVEPRVGRVVLLKESDAPVMGLRVLKTYPDKKQFAAKRIRKYGSRDILEDGSSFKTIEKLNDIGAPPPQSIQDKRDLNELEKTTQPPSPAEGLVVGGKSEKNYDPELDIETSPPPEGAVDSEGSEGDPTFNSEQDEDTSDLTVDEIFPIDTNHQWLTAEFAYIANYAAGGGYSYYTGGGLRYGITVGKMIFLERPKVQDSFVIEGGLFLYKILNYVQQNDAYTVVPLIATGRYNIQFSDTYAIFLYGGLVKSFVAGSAQSTGDTVNSLSGVIPAVGAGMLFGIGPHWDLRLDAGLDMIGVGLVLRF